MSNIITHFKQVTDNTGTMEDIYLGADSQYVYTNSGIPVSNIINNGYNAYSNNLDYRYQITWTNLNGTETVYNISNWNTTAAQNNNAYLVNTYLQTIKNDITSIEIKGLNDVTTCYNLFNKCINLTDINSLEYTSNLTNMAYMFSSCYNLINIPNFNTSNVTIMAYMCYYCNHLINIPNLNTLKVTRTDAMFKDCGNLISVPNFNTSNVTNMAFMFGSCYNLINIPNFNTSKVINMCDIFSLCYNLTSVPNFNTSNVTTMYGMFNSCNNLTDIPNMYTPNVNNMLNIVRYSNHLANTALQNLMNMLPYYNNTNNAPSDTNALNYIGYNLNAYNTPTLSQVQIALDKGWGNTPYAVNYGYYNISYE